MKNNIINIDLWQKRKINENNNILSSFSKSKENKEEFSDENSKNSKSDIYYKFSPKRNINDSDNDIEFNNISKKNIKIKNLNEINSPIISNNNRKQKEILIFRDLLNYSHKKIYSDIQNFSKLNNILTKRNTFPFKKKANYLSLSYILSNKINLNNDDNKRNIINKKNGNNENNNIDPIKNVRIIQKWWRNRKLFFDDIINKIIKIQSVWRGKNTRKYIYDMLYLCYSCQNFFNNVSKILSHRIRFFFWKILFPKENIFEDKILKAKKIFNRFQLKKFFQRWKCIYKLLIIKNDFNKKRIILKKINIINVKDLLRKFFRIWQKNVIVRKLINNILKSKEQMNKYNKFPFKDNGYLEISFLNNIYLKIRLNKIREAFDYINLKKLYFNNMIKSTKKFNNIKKEKDNIFLKKYYLFKWRNQIKRAEINKIKEKLLKYIIYNYSKKYNFNLLHKYFSRWKLLTDDYFKKINNIKNIENNNLKSLILLTEEKIVDLNIIFLRELIRKWRFLIFAKKIAREKILKMYEVMQKTYCKISEDMYDIDQIKEEKYDILNNNSNEDEKNFIGHIYNLYNSKLNPNFKFKYNNKGV